MSRIIPTKKNARLNTKKKKKGSKLFSFSYSLLYSIMEYVQYSSKVSQVKNKK